MTPPPPPFIIQKGRIRLLFNQPRDMGAISIDIDGSGLTIALDPDELTALSKALWYAARRLKP